MTTPHCPNRQELSAYLLGQLPDDESSKLESHIDTCAVCQETIQTIEPAADPFVASLAESAPDHPFEQESQCRRAVELVEAIGRELTSNRVGVAATAEDLGMLRDYRLLAKLGEGGMGAVYKALHTRLEKVVALKVLPARRMQDAQAVDRFHREMRAVGRLDHPQIVRAMDAGDHEGTHFLVMEYVDGLDLSAVVRAVGPLAVADACEAIRQAAVGLQHAHEHGLVHRDIKPGNLMLSTQGQVKILDLGLALLAEDQAEDQMTSTGQVMGTYDYMAPEQAADTHGVDPRSDVYSLGATLYALLVGHPPFADPRRTSAVQKLLAVTTILAPEVGASRPEVPINLVELVRRMLAKSPTDRPTSAAEVAIALLPFCAGHDLLALARIGVAIRPNRSDADITISPSAALASTTRGTDALPAEPREPPLAVVDVTDEVAARAKGSSSRWRHWKIAAGLSGAALLLFGIWVIVKDRNGKELVRFRIPDKGIVILAQDGDPSEEVPSDKTASRPDDSLAEFITPGAPLCRTAFVGHPAPLPSVESWSITTARHLHRIRKVTFSPDGKLLATGGEDGAVRVWKIEGRLLRSIFLGHDDPVRDLVWSRDSTRIYSLGFDNRIYEWNLESGAGRLLFASPGQFSGSDPKHLIGIGYLASQDRLAVAMFGGEVLVLDTKRARPVESFQTQHAIQQFTVSPNGKFLAVSNRQTVLVLRSESGEILNRISAGSERTSLAWSADSVRLAVGLYGGEISIWRVEGLEPLATLGKNEKPWLHGLAWSPTADLIVAHGDDFRVWDLDSMTQRLKSNSVLAYDPIAISPDGELIAIPGYETFELRALDSNQVVWSVQGHRMEMGYFGWSPDGKFLAVAQSGGKERDNGICLLRASDGTMERLWNYTYYGWAWSPEGQELAVALEGGEILFLDPASDKPLRTLKAGPLRWNRIAYSPDGKRLALGNQNGAVELWRLGAEKLEHEFEGHKGEARLAWSPDGQRLAVAGSGDAQVTIWSADEGQPLTHWSSPERDGTNLMAWSPDGNVLATAGAHQDGLWFDDSRTGKLLRRVDNRPGGHGFVWTSNDRLAVFNYGHRCRSLNWLGDQFEKSIISFEFDSYGSPAAPDGHTIASFDSGALRIWDYTTGERHGTLLSLSNGQVVIDASGHYRISHPVIGADLRIVVQAKGAQRTLTLAEFAAQYGWKNDPARVRLRLEY